MSYIFLNAKNKQKSTMCVCKDKRVFDVRKELLVSCFYFYYFPVKVYSKLAVLPPS